MLTVSVWSANALLQDLILFVAGFVLVGATLRIIVGLALESDTDSGPDA